MKFEIPLNKTHKHQLQSIRFSRTHFTPHMALRYLRDNELSPIKRFDPSDNWLRYRLREPVPGAPYYVRKIKKNRIQLVYQII